MFIPGGEFPANDAPQRFPLGNVETFFPSSAVCSDGRVMFVWTVPSLRQFRIGYCSDVTTFMSENSSVTYNRWLFAHNGTQGYPVGTLTFIDGVHYLVVSSITRAGGSAIGVSNDASVTGLPLGTGATDWGRGASEDVAGGGSILLKSTDDGDTWEYVSTLHIGWRSDSSTGGVDAAPSMIRTDHPSGRWVVGAMRFAMSGTRSRLWDFFSSNDSGATWTPADVNFDGSINFAMGGRNLGMMRSDSTWALYGVGATGTAGSAAARLWRSTDATTFTLHETFPYYGTQQSDAIWGGNAGMTFVNLGSESGTLLGTVNHHPASTADRGQRGWTTTTFDFSSHKTTGNWTQTRHWVYTSASDRHSPLVTTLPGWMVIHFQRFHLGFVLPDLDCLPPGPLRIPYVEWPLTQDQTRWLVMWEQNWQAIDRWANSATGANADCALKVPYLRELTPERIKANYLAVERWANCMCKVGNQSSLQLRVPRKDWTIEAPAWDTQNLSELERWVDRIRRS